MGDGLHALRAIALLSDWKLMNKKKVALLLQVSTKAIERYCKRGLLTVRYRRGHKGDEAVYDEQEVLALKGKLGLSLDDQPDTKHQAETGGSRDTATTPDTFEPYRLVPPNEQPEQAEGLTSTPQTIDKPNVVKPLRQYHRRDKTAKTGQNSAQLQLVYPDIVPAIASLTQAIKELQANNNRGATVAPPLSELSYKLVLTLAEATAYSGLTRSYLMIAIKEHKLKAYRIGRSWRVRRSDLEEFIKTM